MKSVLAYVKCKRKKKNLVKQRTCHFEFDLNVGTGGVPRWFVHREGPGLRDVVVTV